MATIRPHDNAQAATYDIEGLSEYMKDCIDLEREKARRVKESADAYLNGYTAAMEDLASIMGASNYRRDEGP